MGKNDLIVLSSLFLQVADVFLYRRAHTIIKSAILRSQETAARSRQAHKWPLRLTNTLRLGAEMETQRHAVGSNSSLAAREGNSAGSTAQHRAQHRTQEHLTTIHDPHRAHGFKLLCHTCSHTELPSNKNTPKTTTCAHLPHGVEHTQVRQTMDTRFLTPMKSKESCLLELRARPSRSVLGPAAVGLLPWGPVPLRKSDRPELRAELSCDWPPVQQPVHT